MTYLIKKLQHQELGSITDLNPRPARGRYLFMPKNAQFLSYLPHLSETVLNDFQVLTIIPLYNNTFQRNYCTFVYNNDIHHGGGNGGQPRDEYRIYLNQALENNQYLFQRDDILVLKPQDLSSINDNGEEEVERVYFAYLEQDHSSDLYNQLNYEVSSSTIRGNYALMNDEIAIIENSIENIMFDSNSSDFDEETAIEVSNTIANRSLTSETAIGSLFGNQTIFRNFTQVGYENCCAVTGQIIRCGDFDNLQAAHIHPRSHGGLYTPNNGILMNRDMHWAFDTGCFTVNDNYTIRVHPLVESEFLQSYNGQEIFIPAENFFRPNIDNLHYHQDNIYGSFQLRGRI